MDLNEFKDKLFDILNETDNLPVEDLVAEDRRDIIKVYMLDKSSFKIQCGVYEDFK